MVKAEDVRRRRAEASRRARGRLKTAFAAGRIFGRERARFAAVMRDGERAHENFAKTAPFWR